MEPTIKSEPCEELYSEHESDYQASGGVEDIETIEEQRPQNSLKRLHDEVEDSSLKSSKYNANNSQHQPFEFPNAPHHLQDGFHIQESNQNMEAKQIRKFKRLDTNVLFNPPFFNLVEELLSPNKSAIEARCYSCGKIVKGNRGISSNFLKHMKRAHAETYKLYEGYKNHKTKSYFLPNLPEMVSRRSAVIMENCASGSDSTTANSNDDTNQFLENGTPLEMTGLNDSSGDNEDTTNATNRIVNTKEHAEFSAKALETLGNIIDEKMKMFVQQREFVQLNEKVNELIRPIKASDVGSNTALTDLRIEVDNLKKECSELRSAVKKSQASRRQLQNELQTVDKLLHQRKLLIKNISVTDTDNPLKSVEIFFKEKMHLENIKIVNCRIIPSAKTSIESNKENLSIELANPQDCKAIFRQTKKLRNTGVFIESEISPFQRKRKNKLIVLRKELLRRKPDLKVLVRDTRLLVNGKSFYWDDVEGLCLDCNYDDINLNGSEYLKHLIDSDLNEFIIFLQNYNVKAN